jgi:hypothetical protein
MVQTFIEISFSDGTITEYPIDALDEVKRLLGHKIKSIKPKTNIPIIEVVEPVIVSTAKKKTK